MLTYIFWPNPPAPNYSDPKVLTLLIICGVMVLASFVVSRWSRKHKNPITRKLTKSYSPLLFWFGLVGLFLIVCRVEGISYLSMRLWWGVWFAGILLAAALNIKLFRMRHYEVLPHAGGQKDPLDQYLPKRKKK